MLWIAALLIGCSQANLPILPYTSVANPLPPNIQDILTQNNLYGESNGYVIPIQDYARGIVRFNISSWLDGSVFDQYLAPTQKKFQKKLLESESITGELDFLRATLKENVDLQKALFQNQINQDIESHAVALDRTHKQRVVRSVKWVVLKEVALTALDYLYDFFFGRRQQEELKKVQQQNLRQWQEDTARFMNNHVFRTEGYLIVSELKETLSKNIGSMIKELVHHNKLHESLYIADGNSLQEAIETILGGYYSGSIFDVFQEKALHTVKATLLLIDQKRKYMEVELKVPVAFIDHKKPAVRILDLGRFHSNGLSFEIDQLPSKWLLDGTNLNEWRAITGNCLSFGEISICDSVTTMDQGCNLGIHNRFECKKQKYETDSEFTLIRRMTQGYVVATNKKEAIHRGDERRRTISLEASVFSVNLPIGDELSVGFHHLNGISDHKFFIRFGLNEMIPILETTQSKIVAREPEAREMTWIIALSVGLCVLFLSILINLIFLYCIRNGYVRLDQGSRKD